MLLNALQTRRLILDALEHRYAILAVNADSPAAIGDCLDAAQRCEAPIIIETSLWQLTGRSFGAGDALTGIARYVAELAILAESERYRDVPVVFHTDHIKGPETLAILAGAIRGLPFRYDGSEVILRPSTISLDSSDLTQEENIEHISTLCAEAERLGVPLSVEMEAGVDQGLTSPEITKVLLGAVEEKHPNQIVLWAPGLGTKHGLSDDGYPEFSEENVMAQRTLAQEITGREIGIALHGSSGLSEAALHDGASAGMVKVNWSSESLLLRSRAAAEYYRSAVDRLAKTDPDFKTAAMDNGVQSYVSEKYLPAVMHRIRVLNGEGKGARFARSIRRDVSPNVIQL